jgi:mannose-6-phosphate isomerase-like protein (cupin superfamily)
MINKENDSMEMESSELSSVSRDPLVVQAMSNVIRFKEIRPNWRVAADGNPAWVIPAYKYTDGAQPNLGAAIPPVVVSEEFRLTAGVVQPGQGAPLHNHTHEELMYAASGSFVIFFDKEEQNKVYLEPWDAILVPANVERGWRNVGRDLGCLLNFSGVQDKMTTVTAAGNEAAILPDAIG